MTMMMTMGSRTKQLDVKFVWKSRSWSFSDEIIVKRKIRDKVTLDARVGISGKETISDWISFTLHIGLVNCFIVRHIN